MDSTPSLSCGSITRDRVANIFGDSAFKGPPNGPFPSEFCCDEGITPTKASEFCEILYNAVKSPNDHFNKLDNHFSNIVRFCPFTKPESKEIYGGLALSSFPRMLLEDPPLSEYAFQPIITGACRLLSRLPATPIDPFMSGNFHHIRSAPAEYLVAGSHLPGASENEPQSTPWEALDIVNTLSTNVIRLAIQIISATTDYSGQFRNYINTTCDLCNSVASRLRLANNPQEAMLWEIVYAFLWTSWQRSLMLHFWYTSWLQMSRGSRVSRLREIALRPIISLISTEMGSRSSHSTKSKYMCSWAYRMLSSDRGSIGQDFRRFHVLFDNHFAQRKARCKQDDPNHSCDGATLDTCQRFKGARIRNQGMHDCERTEQECLENGCHLLFWDESSYRACEGARAVCLDSTDDHLLRYRRASTSSMAISHVWSHGQGGRPELPPKNLQKASNRGDYGLNSCLHKRYTAIAKAAGCDSYWMDTPCIPEDHQLRDEAISHINSIFYESKFTLVCDRDLMSIDAGSYFNTIDTTNTAVDDFQAKVLIGETLLTVLLVCDWNMRAWTFLEANRGNKNLHILCKNNKIVSLNSVITTVLCSGRIDLVILLLTSHHLLRFQSGNSVYDMESWPKVAGLRNDQALMEDAICHLYYRHASRPGDELVIWNLLCGTKIHTDFDDMRSPEKVWCTMVQDAISKDSPLNSIITWSSICGMRLYKNARGICTAEALWKDRIGDLVCTGFLLNSVPRIRGCPGLGWAPARPAIQSLPAAMLSQNSGKHYSVTDGLGSYMGLIKEEGFEAKWFCSKWERLFEPKSIGSWLLRMRIRYGKDLRNMTSFREKLLTHFSHYKVLAILEPVEDERSSYAAPYRGETSGGPLFGLVGSNNACEWEWLGVIEWDMLDKRPPFTKETLLIV